MAIHRYWRIIGIQTPSNTDLELSEFRFYNLGSLADTSCIITSTIAPISGNLSYLTDNSSTNVVTWDYSSWSQSGFSIKYDFGSGQGVEFPKFRIGSGSSQSTWIIDCVSQWSNDNINWTGYFSLNSIHYPGAYSLTTLPDSGTPDIYYSNVSLLINGNGVNASTSIIDNNSLPKSISVFGNAQISTTQSKYGGSSVYFGGTGYLTIPDSNDFAFGSGDFTLEGWLFVPTNITSTQVICGQWNAGGSLSWNLHLSTNNHMGMETSTDGGYVGARYITTGNNAVPISTWFHFSLVRSINTYTIYINGVSVATLTIAGSLFDTTLPLTISGSTEHNYLFTGYMDDLRITKGVARYTSNFMPPSAELSIYPIALDTYTARLTKLIYLPNRILPEVGLQNGSGVQSQKEYIFNDVYYGGSGIISGTTKIKNTLSNIPVMKRVVLIDERSKLVIAERWSDSTTGYFEFKGFRTDILYTLLSYDHTGAFNAVVAVSVVPTLII